MSSPRRVVTAGAETTVVEENGAETTAAGTGMTVMETGTTAAETAVRAERTVPPQKSPARANRTSSNRE